MRLFGLWIYLLFYFWLGPVAENVFDLMSFTVESNLNDIITSFHIDKLIAKELLIGLLQTHLPLLPKVSSPL